MGDFERASVANHRLPWEMLGSLERGVPLWGGMGVSRLEQENGWEGIPLLLGKMQDRSDVCGDDAVRPAMACAACFVEVHVCLVRWKDSSTVEL